MYSVLDVAVSCVPNYYEPDKLVTISLLTWLNSTKHKEAVLKIRQMPTKEERDAHKALLPAVLIFGVFNRRCIAGVVKTSGLLCIDIDKKDNPHIKNYDDLKSQLCKIQNIAYLGLSVSGQGYFAIVAIAHPDKYGEHFDYLNRYFSMQGIKIDECCRDISRLRGISYDSLAYFNHTAVPLTKFYIPPAKSHIAFRNSRAPVVIDSNKDRAIIESIITQVQNKSVDITGNYSTWLGIGCDIASSFGEDGESYFLALSAYYPGDNPKKDSLQYKACLKAMRGKPSSLGALVNAAKKHGVIFSPQKKLTKPTQNSRYIFHGNKKMEVLKNGRLIEVTKGPFTYPVDWDANILKLSII